MKRLISLGIIFSGYLSVAQAEITKTDVIQGYSDLAFVTYSDALTTAEQLQDAIESFVKKPSPDRLEQAKNAWIAARPSYGQSEVFRFGNSIVDDWEAQLNAWPLDEGLIDYVDIPSYAYELGNPGGLANIIANKKIEGLNVSRLTPKTLASLNEFADSEANVATGYHAIEFLLWGQDLNGHGSGAGNRPWTDYAKGDQCTNEHCKRRGQYLTAVTQLLVDDLEYMVEQWAIDGDYRHTLLTSPENDVMNKILYGMGSLALGELAGERIKVAMTANSTEDEHDCFSDNTHNTLYDNAQGIANVYHGHYTDSQGTTHTFISLRDYLASNNETALVLETDQAFENTLLSMQKIVNLAEQGVAFDQMIAPGYPQHKTLLNGAINALLTETKQIEQISRSIGLAQLTPDDAGHTF